MTNAELLNGLFGALTLGEREIEILKRLAHHMSDNSKGRLADVERALSDDFEPVWYGIDDVEHVAKRNDWDHLLTHEDKQSILASIVCDIDPEYGVTDESIVYEIETLLSNRGDL